VALLGAVAGAGEVEGAGGVECLTRALLHRGEFASRADLIDKITDFTIRCKPDRPAWNWACDTRADHVPANAQTLPQAA
jgi:hypothetical protein